MQGNCLTGPYKTNRQAGTIGKGCPGSARNILQEPSKESHMQWLVSSVRFWVMCGRKFKYRTDVCRLSKVHKRSICKVPSKLEKISYPIIWDFRLYPLWLFHYLVLKLQKYLLMNYFVYRVSQKYGQRLVCCTRWQTDHFSSRNPCPETHGLGDVYVEVLERTSVTIRSDSFWRLIQ